MPSWIPREMMTSKRRCHTSSWKLPADTQLNQRFRTTLGPFFEKALELATASRIFAWCLDVPTGFSPKSLQIKGYSAWKS